MWGLCNIFIVHGKHTNVGCTMARLCGAKIVSHFLCAWHVLKAWCLHSMEKIKDPKVKCALLDHLHMVMFMSINLNETIESFKAHGKEIAMESFDNLQPGVVWTRYFGPIIANLVSDLLPSKYGMFWNIFVVDALQVTCWFFTHTWITWWVVNMLCMSMHNLGWLHFNELQI